VEADARAPVVNDERDVPESELFDEAFDVANVVEEAVLNVRLV